MVVIYAVSAFSRYSNAMKFLNRHICAVNDSP